MAADDKVTPLPSLLERLGRRIDAAWKRTSAGEAEWIEGSLELMQAMAEARERFRADKTFGEWLKASGHDHFNHMDRAALLGMASDLTLARDVLNKTDRRSYRYIWEEAQSRFSHVAKPRRGRPRKPRDPSKPKRGRQHKPRDAKEKEAADLMLDQGKSRSEATAETGLSEHVVQLSMERELGRREAFTELLDSAAAQHFSEKGALRIDDAIRIHKARLDKQYEQHVNEEVRRRIAAADDSVRAHNKELRAEVHRLERAITRGKIFTIDEYKAIIRCLHPDSNPSPEIKKRAFLLFEPKKLALTGEQ